MNKEIRYNELDSYSIKELKDFCQKYGLYVQEKATKNMIIKILLEFRDKPNRIKTPPLISRNDNLLFSPSTSSTPMPVKVDFQTPIAHLNRESSPSIINRIPTTRNKPRQRNYVVIGISIIIQILIIIILLWQFKAE